MIMKIRKHFKLFKELEKKLNKKKRELSFSRNTNIELDSLFKCEDLNLKIEINDYEDLCLPLWKKCFKSVDKLISIAKLEKKDIDDLILVGGSSRTPKIKQMIKEYFNGKEPLKTINPDEVVAYGTTLVAHIETLNENNSFN